jgi:hypothetical protein
MADFLLFPYLRSKCDKSELLAVSFLKKFVDSHQVAFSPCLFLRDFITGSSPAFSLLQSAILIRGIQNKKKIEEDASLYQATDLQNPSIVQAIHKRMPFMRLADGEKIFVPFLSPMLNRPYDTRLESLLKPPFQLLKKDFTHEAQDPFDTYGYALYGSAFSSLIPVCLSPDRRQEAFYSIELETVFIIDGQGREDEEICLFDAKTIDRRKDHLFNRLAVLLPFYFANDREGFVDSLYNLHFVTQGAYEEIIQGEKKNERRK